MRAVIGCPSDSRADKSPDIPDPEPHGHHGLLSPMQENAAVCVMYRGESPAERKPAAFSIMSNYHHE